MGQTIRRLPQTLRNRDRMVVSERKGSCNEKQMDLEPGISGVFYTRSYECGGAFSHRCGFGYPGSNLPSRQLRRPQPVLPSLQRKRFCPGAEQSFSARRARRGPPGRGLPGPKGRRGYRGRKIRSPHDSGHEQEGHEIHPVFVRRPGGSSASIQFPPSLRG